ncbi:hypothetical protein FSP39_018770 [Pinctada imbricata]|uniref:Cystatin domain-containing protein n=1 Tax=Pinctada imbricata TaxID=66713 RepID=A0AA88YFC9_PINIB|nr:hypothetical protein FSP39_018770 [Pinctada imbricata]
MRYFGLLCCLVSVLLGCGTAHMQLLGGFDREKTVTKGSEVSQLFDRVKTDIKNALDCFNVGYTGPPTALKYIQQVVAGMNYIVSMVMPSLDGGQNKYFIVKIYEPAHRDNVMKVSLLDLKSSEIRIDTPIKVF